jgi:NADH-quinone oxidoreductase subunit N
VDLTISNALASIFPLVVPEMIMVGMACLLFLGGTVPGRRDSWGAVTLFTLLAAGCALLLGPAGSSAIPGSLPDEAARAGVFSAAIRIDGLAFVVKAIAIGGGLVLALFGWNEISERHSAEFHACLLVMVAGLCLTGSANDLVTLFLALELISIPTYVLLYLGRVDLAAQEAAVKYFLLSIFSSALLLFGFSYLYGVAGTTNLPAIIEALSQAGANHVPWTVQVVLVMVVAGLSFRITAVPFHFYAPDVYQGAPTIVAALLAFVPKVAGFVALFRVMGFVVPGMLLMSTEISTEKTQPGFALGNQVPMLLWILAAVTMSLGNVLGLLQDNLKRLLAYSSVAHAGYMLMALAAAPYLLRRDTPSASGGVEAIVFYLVAYGAMTVGAFAVISYLSTPRRPVENIDDLAGLSRSHPRTALVMALFMFSLTGIPLTAGFLGKLLLFLGPMSVSATGGDDALVRDQAMLYRTLAVIGALNAAIGAWYYLRVTVVMYLRDTTKPLERRSDAPLLAAISLCAALTLFAGIYPGPLLKAANGVVPRAAPATATAHVQR